MASTMLWKTIWFVALSVPIVIVSRSSLGRPRSHGFWRFFAWEAILALALLHVSHWFSAPLAWHQLISWFLLVACCVPVIWGSVQLRRRGAPASERPGDPSLLAFEKTTSLVTTGIYGYIRHPLYASLLLLAWGIFFKRPLWLGGGLATAATILLFLTAKADEAECTRFFGPAYVDYMRRTRRFIPFLI